MLSTFGQHLVNTYCVEPESRGCVSSISELLTPETDVDYKCYYNASYPGHAYQDFCI